MTGYVATAFTRIVSRYFDDESTQQETGSSELTMKTTPMGQLSIDQSRPGFWVVTIRNRPITPESQGRRLAA
jgi:hypothetical protein